MREFRYSIGSKSDGQSVEQLLRTEGYSKRMIVALKQTAEGLTRDGVRVRSTTLLHVGEQLKVTLAEEGSSGDVSALPILLEDDDLIVFDKPAGMPIHHSGSHRSDTVQDAAGLSVFRAVFRLDRDTSGVLLAAKHQLAAGKLWRAVDKRYVAAVGGVLPQTQGVIDLPLERERAYEPRQILSPDGRRAVTRYRIILQKESYALIECVLETGRMHQIRAHFAAIGHPLLGDSLYGGDCTRISRQALHCAELQFSHPTTGEWVRVESPLPEDMRTIWG